MKSKSIALVCMVTIFISFNAVSLKDALSNYYVGKSNSQFLFEQGVASMVIPGFTSILMSLTPGGIAAYPPFIIARLAGIGAVGAVTSAYNRPQWMKVKSKDVAESQVLAAGITPATVSPVSNNMPISLQPSEFTIGDNIIATIITGALAIAGYKIYQWYYNASKKEKAVEAQKAAPLNKATEIIE